MLKQNRLRKLLVQYIELHKYWNDKADYYFNNHSYYLCDFEIEDGFEPLFQEACSNRNIFYYKIKNLKKKIWLKK
jgi:hypothetical protein